MNPDHETASPARAGRPCHSSRTRDTGVPPVLATHRRSSAFISGSLLILTRVRLFLAIELPDDVRSHLLVARQRLEVGLPKIAYTKPANLHLTLKFLGDVDKKRVDGITESLSKIATQRIELHAAGIDCFPARGPVRIVTAAMNGT